MSRKMKRAKVSQWKRSGNVHGGFPKKRMIVAIGKYMNIYVYFLMSNLITIVKINCFINAGAGKLRHSAINTGRSGP